MENKRFIINIPYYAEDVSEVREVVKKLAEVIDVPYASIHTQCSSDDYKTIFVESVETEISGLLGDFLKTKQ
tara:strand:- start:7747 stop:7962 length:216 start_codon:yes stop_codon:yes gene_type:complete